MRYTLTLLLFLAMSMSYGQLMEEKETFNHYDTLRGSITKYRQGWDVLQYDILVQLDIQKRSITGKVIMTWLETTAVNTMQIDLQQPLIMDSVVGEGHYHFNFRQDSDVCFIYYRDSTALYKIAPGVRHLTFYYHGQPIAARRPPWDGGFVWRKDEQDRPFVATACQGTGASAWWPCKDHQSDKPDSGIIITIIAPDTLSAISNGRLQQVIDYGDSLKAWTWAVKNPINTYNVTLNIGKYITWSDTLMGEDGKLDLQYWVLDYNHDTAKAQFQQVKPMLRNHEYWFGKYPFYEDGFKLIETPFLGMEHQSGIAYGNHYRNGYLGKDLSATGWGLKWDFIIVHEAAHEWWGNNITTKDIADMWVHEGFANYSETLFTQYLDGKEAGEEYCRGIRKLIRNDRPIIGFYGVNKEGSGDMYYKGGNMLHIIRNAINDDSVFRNVLRGLNDSFYHSTVSSYQIEDFISYQSGIDFTRVFDQYLRTTDIPVLEYYYKVGSKHSVMYVRWNNVLDAFRLPLHLKDGDNSFTFYPTEEWKRVIVPKVFINKPFAQLVENSYYVQVKQVK